mgnify:CR=1 FL=1
MDDLDISPLVGQVFGDEAAVAVIRRLFAAKEAAVGHECSREVLFDFAFRDEFQKSPPVRRFLRIWQPWPTRWLEKNDSGFTFSAVYVAANHYYTAICIADTGLFSAIAA